LVNFTVVLDDGEDIFVALETFAKENDIVYGFVAGGKGAIKDFDIISHGQRGTVERVNYKREFEVNALSGKIEYRNKTARININALISSSGFTPVTGELLSGKAAGSLQITIKKVDLSKMIEA
jgi:predicted DNA-binding protein with PD1-like motif